MTTISENGWPHCVPMGYVYLNGKFLLPAGPKSKKIRNLMQNQRATILINDEDREHGDDGMRVRSPQWDGRPETQGLHEEGQGMAE